MPVILIFLFITIISGFAVASETEEIIVYNRNLLHPHVKDHLYNTAKLSEKKFGRYYLKPSLDMELGDAFEALINGEIDILVTAPTVEREKQAKAIYVPLDKGLLGFRLCLIHKDSFVFNSINSVESFRENISVGVGSNWADRYIYEENNIEVVTSSTFIKLFDMLENKEFDCFSRSVNEITEEYVKHANRNIKIENTVVIIYPNADFIFVNPKKQDLYERFSYGIEQALINGSFETIFEKHFDDLLEKYNIYDRKLLILQRSDITKKTLKSINTIGIASFTK